MEKIYEVKYKDGKILRFLLLTFNLVFIISFISFFEGTHPKAYAIANPTRSAENTEAKIIAEELARQKRAERKSLITDLFNQAKRSYDSKDYETAQQLFERVVQLDPSNRMASKYIELCKEAMVKELPESVAGSLIRRGKANYRDKQYAAAVVDFENALLTNPNDAEAKAWLEKAKAALGLNARKKTTKEELKFVGMGRDVAAAEKDTAEESMLLQVDRGWLPPEKLPSEEVQVEEIVSPQELAEQEARKKLEEKMASIVVPAISVTDADVQELIRQLMELTGVTIVLDERALAEVTKDQPIKISLTTANPMPLLDILNIAFKTTQLGYKVEPNYVWVSSKANVSKEELVTRTYRLKYGVRQTRKVELKEMGETSTTTPTGE